MAFGVRQNRSVDWADLRSLYVDRHLSCKQIAHIKKCGATSVHRKLKEFGIPANDMSFKTRMSLSARRLGASNPFYGKKHTEAQKVKWKIERTGIAHHRFGKTLSLDTKMKISNTMKNNQISAGTNNPMYGKKHTEDTKRLLSQRAEGKYVLENNPMWRGGKSFEPYTLDFNQRFKEAIKERDNHTCLLCHMDEEDIESLGRVLAVHHVDYIKVNSFPQNCASLCNKCHSLTNANRNHWKTFFQSLLAERYGYTYTADQKIILDFMEVPK